MPQESFHSDSFRITPSVIYDVPAVFADFPVIPRSGLTIVPPTVVGVIE